MSREDIIRRIVERESQQRGLTEEAVLQDAPDLHQAACEHFGAWDTALQYAGVSVRRLYAKPRYTREEVIRRIRNHCCKGGKPSAKYFQNRDWHLYSAARYYFGRWRQALQAAGVNLHYARLRAKRARQYDKEQLLAALREWKAAGHSLEWPVICLQNRALATAVRHVCGSWHRAMSAVGLVPEKRPDARKRKWSPQRVIECLQLRHQEGKPMHYKPMHADDNSLLCAAKAYFGNLGNALAAAGIEVEQRKLGRPAKKDGGA